MLTRLLTAALVIPVASTAAADFVGSSIPQRIDYLTSDIDDWVELNIDVDGDGGEDFTFRIVNSSTENYFGALDYTRNNGFIGDFDDEFNHVLRTFAPGEPIGPDLEDDLGIETLSYADYQFDLDTGTPLFIDESLASSSVILGFGFYAGGLGVNQDEEGIIYGWMRVTFGELLTTEPFAPSNSFIEVTEFAFSNTLGQAIPAGVIPTPGSLALLAPLAGAIFGRRQ